jgi:hypothetical protein
MKAFPTLYKLSSSGKLQLWSVISYHDETHPFYRIGFGQIGGKIQEQDFSVTKGMNLGKKNETTPSEQCLKEAEALWTKKIQRGGYTTTKPTDKPLKPMLAKNFKDDKTKVKFPCYIQPKLDGARCIAKISGGKVQLISRSLKEFTCLPYINKALSVLPDCILDGELYNHDLTFQEIISKVKKKEYDSSCDGIEYHIYDCINDKKFEERLGYITYLHNNNPKAFKLVDTFKSNSENDITNKYSIFVGNGYEGAIIRNSAGLYKINARSSDLLKLKEFDDAEFEIVDVIPSDKEPDKGIFVCKTIDSVIFNCTPKCTDEQKQAYLRDRDKYIGKLLTVKYFGLTTTDGKSVPRFPVGLLVRDWE